jgi:hypothetical protein
VRKPLKSGHLEDPTFLREDNVKMVVEGVLCED